jgi:hypothetical protein
MLWTIWLTVDVSLLPLKSLTILSSKFRGMWSLKHNHVNEKEDKSAFQILAQGYIQVSLRKLFIKYLAWT